MTRNWLWSLAALPALFVARKLRKDPQFGGKPEGTYLKRLKASPQWKRGRFRNIDRTPIQEDFKSLIGDLIGYMRAKDTFPRLAVPTVRDESPTPPDPKAHYLTWYGHSALRLETNGQTILLDPMLEDWVAPIPFLGHRFQYAASPLNGDFERINLVIFSHDHYDHLDMNSIERLDPVTDHYLVPLGVGIHLMAWGVSAEKITELDWWDCTTIKGVEYTLTPARHFGGRSPGMRNKSLWGSFAIRLADGKNIYFGGDSGYGSHFKEIGEKLGPFDLTMLDCGQYHDRWQGVHMQPEEAIQAHDDLNGDQLLPIHWGGFTLSNHPWSDPIRRILEADRKACVLTPSIGERFQLGSKEFCQPRWWEE
ncbi:hypothetical protein CEQ90_15990 [Lewinellaceae bacterium SD302]|nr:hypothetical protein CEQ90_15990 [Lewinellaceae bacterium SD302]